MIPMCEEVIYNVTANKSQAFCSVSETVGNNSIYSIFPFATEHFYFSTF